MPGTIEPSKEKRHCGADDCNEQLVGTSIGHHYRSRTDFEKLKVLRNLPRQLAEDELTRMGTFISEKRHWAQVLVPATVNRFSQLFIDIFEIGFLL